MIVKNSFGCSVVSNPKFVNPDLIGEFTGSSLNRKKKEEVITESLKEKEETVTEKKKKWRSLSSRTKSKIRKKLYAFFGQYKRLTFLTLTFVNIVSDEIAVKLLGMFLDNIKKQDKNFEFVWIAERQTKNTIFQNNIHFHLITNKFWNIKKSWAYWLTIQKRFGIIPRDENYKPTSAFDVKTITSKNSKGIGTYLTKYVTKNADKFLCQVWNCSKKVSRLYTDFYTDYTFLKNLEKLEERNEITIKRLVLEYCNMFCYPITKTTMRFYDKLHLKNQELWKS